MEGVFVLAINKPPGMSSAQALRNLQAHFNPSEYFKPWLDRERAAREQENRYQQKRRSRAKRHVQVKLGHGGTLDPAATGVLICGIGKGTKSLQSFLECTKTYEATVIFGAATDSYDGVGKVVGRKPFGHIDRSKVEKALERFRGKFKQKPPIFSALHVDGKRLYEYAREGKEVPGGIEERDVDVESLELVQWLEPGAHQWRYPQEALGEEKAVAQKLLEAKSQEDANDITAADPNPGGKRKAEDSGADPPPSKHVRAEIEPSDSQQSYEGPNTEQDNNLCNDGSKAPAVKLRITSSRGFYVRSLCHDLGQALDSFAYMASLTRTRQGDFRLEQNVLEYEDLDKGEQVWAPQIQKMLQDWNGRNS